MMHSLPSSFDSSYLEGKQIESICFLEFQVNIYFSDKAVLQIEGIFEFTDASGVPETSTEFPLAHSRLPSIVGDTVQHLSFDGSTGNIRLLFSKGAMLRVEGGSGPYESYRLLRGNEDIVV
jgi:hypothetical protein